MSDILRRSCALKGSAVFLKIGAGLVGITFGLLLLAQWLVSTQADLAGVLLLLVGATWAHVLALSTFAVMLILIFVRVLYVCRTSSIHTS